MIQYFISVLLITLIIEIIFFYFYKKKLKKPFRRIVIDKQDIIVECKDISVLYSSYKRIPPEMFTIVKLNLKSNDPNYPIKEIVEFAIKLILTIGVALIGLTASVSGVLLSYAQNKEKIENQFTNAWSNVATDLVQAIKLVLNTSWNTLTISSCLFALITVDIYFTYLKKKEYEKHMNVIEQIENERS
ncbi:hypothetical protein PAALTS15_05793 [Paenibacillus alvei TS-15]|uniref:MotA/TolQ/ExbB proton channel domain-containing protein n=1 Tax=Paenibacillus alvei TS-15 TaxID=1117108 RepID=S9U139_PAEAL|nr:hypothetical protein [Paenibacillus alvei]EPY08216.1 hypothetical protein PAALTS15_05793 [Paenibacillus alvei TS-15]